MPRPFGSLFSRKKSQTLAFKDYYTNWFNTLQKTLLPLIEKSLSSSSSQTLLYSHVDLLLRHFLSYYDALDDAATKENLPQLLFPPWRNNLEIPFLFLGDLHPYLFTNLVRSFLDEESEEGTEGEEEEEEGDGDVVVDNDDDNDDGCFEDRPWQVFMAWRNVSKNLMSQIEQIERGLRLMVPALIGRVKKAQGGFVRRVAEDWAASSDSEGIIGEAMDEEIDELVSVFVDANRLRKSVISEIVGALSVYQAAWFLEALAQFLVGLRDRQVLGDFNRCNIPIT